MTKQEFIGLISTHINNDDKDKAIKAISVIAAIDIVTAKEMIEAGYKIDPTNVGKYVHDCLVQKETHHCFVRRRAQLDFNYLFETL